MSDDPNEDRVSNLDSNSPWNPGYYDEDEKTTASSQSYITVEELESIFYILLILFYIALPVSLILLRCVTIKNVPKLDIAFLFNAYILKAKKFAEPPFQSKKIAEKVLKTGRKRFATNARKSSLQNFTPKSA